MGDRVKTHTLKCDPGPFEFVWNGTKRAEVRRNDRGFEVGDTLLLLETNGLVRGEPLFTGRRVRARITHKQDGYGIPEPFCVLSLRITSRTESEAYS